MAAYINLLKDKIPEKLFSEGFLKSAKRLLELFPIDVTNTFGFEYNLNIDVGPSGLALAIPCRKEYKVSFIRFLSGCAKGYGLRHKSWRILKKVSHEWMDVSSPLYSNLLGIWLEFDVPLDLELPIPNVFFGPLRIGDKEMVRDLILLLTRDEKIIDNVMHCIEHLPDTCQVFHVGRMFSRDRKGIRLVAKGFDRDSLLRYLDRIGWKEDQKFIDTIEEISSNVNRILINFEIDKKLDPHIGIEFSFKPDKLCREYKWHKFLSWLSIKGLVDPRISKDLLAFPGFSIMSNLNEKWPNILIARYIGHIKIVYKGTNKYLTKSYLAIRTYRAPIHNSLYTNPPSF